MAAHQFRTTTRFGLKAILLAACFFCVPAALAQSGCLGSFRNPQDRYAHNTANSSLAPLELAVGTPLGEVKYRPSGEATTYTLEDYLTKFCTTGFLVLKDGQIVFERYLQGYAATDAVFSASMSKTLLSLLMGIAVSESKLKLDEKIPDILPDFKESAFAESTVEDLLRMSSGVAMVNSHQAGAPSDNRATDPIVSPGQDVRAYLRNKKDRAAASGTVFEYNGAQSALLGIVMTERLGMTMTAYLENKLWMPMGAEGRSHWMKNFRGEEGVQGQFAATVRDYARLGNLVMNQGRANGKEIVPASWIVKMVELRRDKPQPNRPPFYGLHVWIPQAAGGRSMFWGTNGQNIFVDPIAKVVIVHTGNSPKAEFDGNRHLFALRDAIVQSLTGRP